MDILEEWEQEWVKLWPKPERKDLLQWVEGEGGSMKGLIEAAKLFVQKKIAEGCPYKPTTIFSLHIHTQTSRIQSESHKACSQAADIELRERWNPYINNLETCL